MANLKVNLSEVQSFVEEQKKEMKALRLGLSEVESNINQITEMETFKGETAKAAKIYFRDYHGTLLQAFIGLSNQLERNLVKHLNDFKSNVDSNDLTVLDQSYIEDQEEDIHRMYKQLEGISKEIDAIIKSVSDITSAQSPSFLNVMNRKEETVEVTSDVTEQLVAFTKRGKADHHHVQEAMAEIEALMKAGQKKTAQSITPDWFRVQLPTIQSRVNDAKKNKAFASVISNESFLQRVVKQSGVTHTQIGRTTLGLAKYVKNKSFNEQVRTGHGLFVHSPLGRSLLHYRTGPRFQFLYSFATKVPLAAMRSTMTFEHKQQKDMLEGRLSVDSLKSWWNETITHQIDLSLFRIVSLAFTRIPDSTINTTVDAGETGETNTDLRYDFANDLYIKGIETAFVEGKLIITNFSSSALNHPPSHNKLKKELEKIYDYIACLPPDERNRYYSKWADHAIDSVEVIDEYAEYGGIYHVAQNGRIIREFYEKGMYKFEEVGHIPEDRIGGARELDGYFEGTPIWFVEYISPGSAIKSGVEKLGRNAFSRIPKGNVNVTVPQNAKDLAKQIKQNNGTPPQGYKGGREFKNDARDGGQVLPQNTTYKEYDIHPHVKGQNRGVERIVIGDDGSVWYTDDHYKTFIRIE